MVFAVYEQGLRIHTPKEMLLQRPAIRQTQAISATRRLVDEDGKAEHFQDISDQTWIKTLQDHPDSRPKEETATSSRAMNAYAQASKAKEKPSVLPAEQIMRSPVITLAADANLNQAWQLMQQEQIHYLVLLDAEGKLAGVVDDRELLKEAAGLGVLSQQEGVNLAVTAIKELVKAPLVCASLDTDIRDIARVMLAQKVRAMPILDAQEELKGLVTRSDLMLALVNQTLEIWT